MHAGGIACLVDLLLNQRTGPHENATRATWCLANTVDHQMGVARAGAIAPLVNLLETGSPATQEHAAAAVEALARGSDENQTSLAKARAISPLVALLASESSATQQHAVGALLFLASHTDSKASHAVIRQLVDVLDNRNASAAMKSASALAVLAARSASNRTAIFQAKAVPPLVRLGSEERASQQVACTILGYVLTHWSVHCVCRTGAPPRRRPEGRG